MTTQFIDSSLILVHVILQLPAIEQSVKEAGHTILTPLVSLDTPGKATVEVVILADPVSQARWIRLMSPFLHCCLFSCILLIFRMVMRSVLWGMKLSESSLRWIPALATSSPRWVLILSLFPGPLPLVTCGAGPLPLVRSPASYHLRHRSPASCHLWHRSPASCHLRHRSPASCSLRHSKAAEISVGARK